MPAPSALKALTSSTPPDFTPAALNLKDYGFDGEYVGLPLQRVCEKAQWTSGMSFVCDDKAGGIDNIRDYMTCIIPYPIDASEVQLILPRIQSRSQDKLGKLLTT